MIDSLFEATPDNVQLTVKKASDRCMIGRTNGGMNAQLHNITDAKAEQYGFISVQGTAVAPQEQ